MSESELVEEKRFYIENFEGYLTVRDRTSVLHPICCNNMEMAEAYLSALTQEGKVVISRECAEWAARCGSTEEFNASERDDPSSVKYHKGFQAELQQALQEQE